MEAALLLDVLARGMMALDQTKVEGWLGDIEAKARSRKEGVALGLVGQAGVMAFRRGYLEGSGRAVEMGR